MKIWVSTFYSQKHAKCGEENNSTGYGISYHSQMSFIVNSQMTPTLHLRAYCSFVKK
jgi:hypothetical protein